MAYISYNKIWESEYDNIVSEKHKVQDINKNQIKLEVYDTSQKDEKITSFKPSDEDVINKFYLDGKISELDDHLSFLEKD